ncbi:MAG TPA: flagellar brake protein [Noviherbaspirillum sp.]|nr:flagellar brake protein [Noviherbaspirillum sp.]
MTLNTDDDDHDLSRYQVRSRREITNLLRTVGERNQLVRMQANNGADSVVTSILEVDDAAGIVIIDCSPSALTNQRVLDSDDIAFETVLENIRIKFSVSHVESCEHDDRPAFYIPIPESMVRLQRREFYRVAIPVSSPARCTIPVPAAEGGATTPTVLPVYNVSGGGIAVVDEKKLIPSAIGTVFTKCKIDFPGSPVEVTLQLMNSHDLTLSNGKNTRRLGFMFVDLPNATIAAIQRYITKLEREQNARTTGMG